MTEDIESIDFENRVLCADGGCTGVIGGDGRCKECGAVYQGPSATARRSFGEDDATDDDSDAAASRADAIDAMAAHAPIDGAGDAAIENRELCPDGACIGVLGDDGRCRVCGRTAASS